MSEEEKENKTESEYNCNEAIDNFKMGYNYLFDDYGQQIARLHNADQKINMFLVFNAAIVALLTVVFPFNTESQTLYTLFIVCITLFVVSMIATVTTIIISLYPKGSSNISNDNFVSPEFYNRPTKEFMGEIMAYINSTINELQKHIEKKMLCAKIISIETILNIVLVIFLLIFKIL